MSNVEIIIFLLIKINYFCECNLSRSVTGNTSDSGSEELRFEPLRDSEI